jgi:hypothetical protein
MLIGVKKERLMHLNLDGIQIVILSGLGLFSLAGILLLAYSQGYNEGYCRGYNRGEVASGH